MGNQTLEIDSEHWRRILVDGARDLGVALSAAQAAAMGRHARELMTWNRVTNLTAITDPLAVALKHYVDALAAVPGIGAHLRILDAGAGGGFPGIPIGIARRDLNITLVDSVRKKISFLKYALAALALDNVTAVHGRLEELARMPAFAGRFDLVVCRAFAAVSDFADLTLPFLAPGGRLLAMKGPQAAHDHEAGTPDADGTVVFGGKLFSMQIQPYTLPGLGDRRRLVWLTPASG